MEQLTEHNQQYFNALPLEDLLKFTNHAPFNFIVNNGWIDSFEWIEKTDIFNSKKGATQCTTR